MKRSGNRKLFLDCPNEPDLVAVLQLGITDPHAWFAESDNWGPGAKWQQVFTTASSETDGRFRVFLREATGTSEQCTGCHTCR